MFPDFFAVLQAICSSLMRITDQDRKAEKITGLGFLSQVYLDEMSGEIGSIWDARFLLEPGKWPTRENVSGLQLLDLQELLAKSFPADRFVHALKAKSVIMEFLGEKNLRLATRIETKVGLALYPDKNSTGRRVADPFWFEPESLEHVQTSFGLQPDCPKGNRLLVPTMPASIPPHKGF